MTDREKLIELLDMNCGYVAEMKAEELADYLISKGVAIPVRCGECKHGDLRFSGLCFNEKCCVEIDGKTYATEIHEDRFCSYGERRGVED